MVCGPDRQRVTEVDVLVTVMVWLAVLVLPHASLAVQVRVMPLACGQAPGVVTSAKLRLGFGSQLSLTAGWLNTGVWPHSMVCGPATPAITAVVVSATDMVWLPVWVSPPSP